MKWIEVHTIYALLVAVVNIVSGQECMGAVSVGSLSHDSNIVTASQTFIFPGYTIPCSGTVVAWEFCYQSSNATSMTFYPGIWRITRTRDNVKMDCELIQSNSVTYDPRSSGGDVHPCKIFNLSTTGQFTAPAGSVVGLYSNVETQLLHTNTDGPITTYQFSGNQSSIKNAGNNIVVNYTISIRVHLVNSSTNITTSSTSATSAVKPSSSNRQTNNDDSSSSVAGIVAGCVVGIVVIIVIAVLLILLVWYLRRRRRKNEGKQDVAQRTDSKLDSEGLRDHHYSVVGHKVAHDPTTNGMVTIKDGVADNKTFDNPGYYSKPHNLSKPGDIIHYMDPTTIIVKDHPKTSSDDYMVLPTVNEYETPHSQSQYYFELSANFTVEDDIGYSTVEPLPGNEPIYEDPGHNKEKIYAWFEKKKFRVLQRNDIQTLQQLGSGEFGVVHLGLWSNGSADPVQVAVKTLNSQCSESDRVKFLREAAIMGQFVHNNVVQLHGVVTEEENMMIVLEYMPKGDLQDNLAYLKTLPPQESCSRLEHNLLSFCRQIAAGMNYLASKQFVHRDLAARNILVSSDDVCKIADFGMARDVADDTYYITSGGKIPVKWTAPEAIFFQKYSVQSDVWSFGCVMYEIWSLGHKPFEDLSGKRYVEKITKGYRLPPPPGCPRAMYELMIQCWHPTARDRPTSGSISRTIQQSDRTSLTSSVQVTEDQITKENHSMVLGAPLTAGSQLYLDLQQRYTIKSS